MALLAVAFSLLAPLVQAGENRTITISDDSFAAIAYSPSTGKYGYAYDRRSRKSAEADALKECGAEDATIACWVNKGFCAIALGSDKSCWGSGWSFGGGATSDRAKNQALEDCRGRTSGAHIALAMSSDGQYVWDQRDNTTVIDKNGNVYDGYGRLIKPSSGGNASPTPSPSPNSDSKT